MKTLKSIASRITSAATVSGQIKHRWIASQLAGIVAVLLSQPGIAGVVLTFDHNPLTNFERIDQNYGDRVTTSPDAAGHQYGFVDDGFGTTPNVELAYGGSLPSLWTTGYGDLVNILFNDQDGETSLNLTLTADPGFEVGVFSFDLASFSNAGQTIPGLQVIDTVSNATLFSQGSTDVTGTAHENFAFSGGLFARNLTIDIDLTGLGTVSDNIGIDNVYFVQREMYPVPVPAAVWLFGSGLIGLMAIARRKNYRRK